MASATRSSGRNSTASAGTGRTPRPSWTGYATLAWAAAYGVFGLASTIAGAAVFYRAAQPLPVALNWAVVIVAVLSATSAAAVVRLGGWRCPQRAVFVTLVGSSLLSGAAAFGLLMDIITLAVDQSVDTGLATANRALAAIGVVLLTMTARSYRFSTAGHCPRCGAVHSSASARHRAEPTAAPRRVRLLAYAGAAAFLPYVAMKMTWVLGGSFAGISGAQMLATAERNGASGVWLTLARWGIDATVLLAALGVFLLLGLVRPWGQVFPRWTLVLSGRRVPRWLPLTPALIGAATLAPYGAIGVVYAALGTAGVVTVAPGDFPTSDDALLVTWIGVGSFAVYGMALSVSAWSYLRRTRPVCAAAALTNADRDHGPGRGASSTTR